MNDRRILRSQELIKQAFLDLLSSKKFEEISIKEIADNANVGRRTFYHHYLDKYDLMEKMIDEHVNHLHEICIDSSTHPSSSQELLWFSYFEENYNFFSVMLSNGGKSIFHETFLDFVKKELYFYTNKGQLESEGISDDLYCTFCASGIVGVIEEYFAQNSNHINSEIFSMQVMKLVDKLY